MNSKLTTQAFVILVFFAFLEIPNSAISGELQTIGSVDRLNEDINCSKESSKVKTIHEANIIYVGGLMDTTKDLKDFMKGDEKKWFDKEFKCKGLNLKIAEAPEKGSIRSGATLLKNDIFYNQYVNDEKFHIIAKSMGGLWVRAMINQLSDEQKKRVLSITTIATPHWGSLIADIFKDKVKNNKSYCSVLNVVDAKLAFPFIQTQNQNDYDLNTIKSDAFELCNSFNFNDLLEDYIEYFTGKNRLYQDKKLQESVNDLSTEFMAKFNESQKEIQIPFFTFALAIAEPGAILKTPLGSIGNKTIKSLALFQPNDGLVTVSSALAIGDKKAEEETQRRILPNLHQIGCIQGEHVASTTPYVKYANKPLWKEVFKKIAEHIQYYVNNSKPIKSFGSCDALIFRL